MAGARGAELSKGNTTMPQVRIQPVAVSNTQQALQIPRVARLGAAGEHVLCHPGVARHRRLDAVQPSIPMKALQSRTLHQLEVNT